MNSVWTSNKIKFPLRSSAVKGAHFNQINTAPKFKIFMCRNQSELSSAEGRQTQDEKDNYRYL
jgi:hypothetical protein